MTADPTSPNCCAPSRPEGASSRPPPQSMGSGAHRAALCPIPGGAGLMGTNRPVIKLDGEAPQRRVKLKPFLLGQTPVSNAEFSHFAEQTGYVTEAEVFGWSFVFHLQVPAAQTTVQGAAGAQWWRRVDGANWRYPAGPLGAESLPDHPAVHLSWTDAQAYCAWAGGRLPSEAEWEHAARGGLGDVTYPWGDAPPDDRAHLPCNIWQGNFPTQNTAADGYAFTSPARSFAPNGYGLYGMAGNVWDWTADLFRLKSLSKAGKAHAAAMRGYRVIKGGSFLCHASYCTRYRIAARTGNSPESTTSHMGFRIAFDAPPGRG
ncbi:formylglycine-generating enzyme family protein [bacterium]|nr:formylglycine-generating enzyme family protein [Planktomarina temperata]MDA9046461.1 formylglycine-generating enzyme family protein [Planktomarina temperata]MDC1395929.1 formylglycine-generating enzyme family protein [bacterium]